MSSNPSDLRATGDAMQSALSRLVEFVEAQSRTSLHVHYEVMACIPEAKSAVDAWTALRRQDAVRIAPVDCVTCGRPYPCGCGNFRSPSRWEV